MLTVSGGVSSRGERVYKSATEHCLPRSLPLTQRNHNPVRRAARGTKESRVLPQISDGEVVLLRPSLWLEYPPLLDDAMEPCQGQQQLGLGSAPLDL